MRCQMSCAPPQAVARPRCASGGLPGLGPYNDNIVAPRSVASPPGRAGRGNTARSRQPIRLEQLIAVCPDLAGEGCALTRVLRQARLVRPEAIARIPFRCHVLLDPRGLRRTELRSCKS